MTSRDSDGPGGEDDRNGDLPHLPYHLDPRGKAAARRADRDRARGLESGSGAVSVSALGRRHGYHTPRGVRGTVMVVLAMVSVLVVAGSGWAWYRYREFNQNVVRLDVIGAGPSSSSGSKPVKDIDGKAQNILLIGNDDRSDATPAELKLLGTQADGGSINADTMLLIHIPSNGKNAVAVSFPRDSYVQIADGFGMHKLNSAYPDGYYQSVPSSASTLEKQAAGGKVLIQTLQNLTGLTIDHYASVDLLGFYRISQAIGGVTVNMCNAVQDSYSGINLKKGVQTISGTQALAFVRQRHGLAGGDLDRIKRQQYFLSAAFRKITSAGVLLNPTKLTNLLGAVDSSLQLDRTLQLTSLAAQISGLSANNITFKTIPTNGNITTSDGDSLSVDPGQVQAFVQQLIGNSTGTKLVAPSSVTLDVMNGGGTTGAAATAASTLQKAGFKTGQTGDASSSVTTTTVEYPAGQLAQAATVAQYVPGATTTQTSSVTRVTLVLGTDGKKAIAALPKASTPATTTAPTTPTKPADQGCIN